MRALGLQNKALHYFVIAYYVITVPLTLILGVVLDFQIKGWYTGFNIGEFVFCYLSYKKIHSLNLKEQAEVIKKDLMKHQIH